MRERDLQLAILDYLRLALGPRFLAVPIPNEGMAMKRTVGEKGTPDIVVTGRLRRRPGNAHGMMWCGWIEVKTAKGRLSAAQADFAAACIHVGVPHAVVRDIEDAEAALRSWGFTPRATAKG